jgi:hypothetical protein
VASPSQRICHPKKERSRSERGRNRSKERNRLACCVLGVLQVTALSPPAEKGRGDETKPDPPGFQVLCGGA